MQGYGSLAQGRLGRSLNLELLFLGLRGARLLLHVGEAKHLEDQHLVLDVLQEVLRHHRLRVLVRVVKLRVPVLALTHHSLVLRVLQVDLVFDENIFAEVRGQVSGTLNVDQEVDAAVEKILLSLWQVLIRKVFVAIGVHWNHVQIELTVILVVRADKVDGDWVVNQV